MLAPKGSTYNGRPTFANPMYLKKAQSEKPCLYEIPCDQCDIANLFAPDREETLTLEQESILKLNTDLVKPYDYTKKNSLYKNFKPPSWEYLDQLAHANEVRRKMWRKSFVKYKPHIVKNIEREQYFEIQDLKAQLQEKNIAISELKKLVEKCKEKSMETKFDKSSVVRQPNALRIPKPSVLGKPTPFQTLLRGKVSKRQTNQAVRNTNVIRPGMYRIDTRTTHTRAPQLPQTSRNTNPRVSTSTGVIHKTSISRPQLRSTQMKEKVMQVISQVKSKKTKVKDHHKIFSISKKTKSVTACNDSLKTIPLNVNDVCATCEKCVFNPNHDACVSKFINDVNARTKKPKVVPISTRKPKSQANKSVVTPYKKTVASDSTIQKCKSYFRMLYENTNKAWKWWIEKQCPSGYKWTPKTQKKWVPKIKKDNVSTSISPTIDNASRITNVLKITNSLGSNLSNVPSSSNSLNIDGLKITR
ncbi:hypothetical protein Tco_0714447 [Tanacetum coccineum]